MISLLFTLSAQAACLEQPLTPEAPEAPEADAGCGAMTLRAAGRAYANSPATGVSRGVAMHATRFGVELGAPGDVGARFVVVPVQTGGEAGYVAVDGESLVPAVQIAEARWDWKAVGGAVAAGVVDDPWTAHELRVFGLRTISPGMAQAEGWMPRSDVGGWAAWTAPQRRVTGALSVRAGEGADRRERNNGVDTAVSIVVRPLADEDLELMLYGREGSRGILKARDHRVGLIVSGGTEQAKGGLQLLQGWGYDADATLKPFGISAFARTHALPVLGYLRADHVRAQRPDPATATTKLMAGAGPRLPWTGEQPAPAALTAGVQAELPAADGGPTAGQAQNRFTVFLQLSADLQGAWTLGER